jgi:hypothetical protein
VTSCSQSQFEWTRHCEGVEPRRLVLSGCCPWLRGPDRTAINGTLVAWPPRMARYPVAPLVHPHPTVRRVFGATASSARAWMAHGSRVGRFRLRSTHLPRLRSGEAQVAPPAVASTSRIRSRRCCPQLSGRRGLCTDQSCSRGALLGQVQPDLRRGSCGRWIWALPGPAAIPMASTGARSDCQEMRGLSSWQGGTAEGGGQPSAVPRSWIIANQPAPGRSQGEGNSSPCVLLVRQVHDCLGPSDIFAVRQLADGLDAKRLP